MATHYYEDADGTRVHEPFMRMVSTTVARVNDGLPEYDEPLLYTFQCPCCVFAVSAVYEPYADSDDSYYYIADAISEAEPVFAEHAEECSNLAFMTAMKWGSPIAYPPPPKWEPLSPAFPQYTLGQFATPTTMLEEYVKKMNAHMAQAAAYSAVPQRFLLGAPATPSVNLDAYVKWTDPEPLSVAKAQEAVDAARAALNDYRLSAAATASLIEWKGDNDDES